MILPVGFFALSYFNLYEVGNTRTENLGRYLILIMIFPLLTSFFYHFLLRLALYLEKKMPLRWVSFFKYATSARILEQGGGQWRFRHQILQDYFARRYDG